MNVAFYETSVRYGIAVGVILLGVAALLAVKRRHPIAGAAMGVVASLGAIMLAGEALVIGVVRLAAPDSADFNEYRWVMLSPWGRIGLSLGGIAVAAIIALAWRGTRGLSTWRRVALIGLRAGAALTALVLFVEPAVELRQVAREPNRIAIVVDTSRSMALHEDPAGPSRIERVARLLDDSADTLAAWSRDHQLDYFAFSDNASALGTSNLHKVPATGTATRIRRALDYVRSRYEGKDLAGIVLISDGAATDGAEGDAGEGAQRDFLRGLDTRVHTVWAAVPGLRDTAVQRVFADEFAFVRTVVKIEAVIHTTGLPARQLPVTLSTDGAPLRQKTIDLPPGDADVTVSFEITPPRVGRYVYEVSVPVADGEAVVTNNARNFVIRVIRDKIRVLQVAGGPSWDVRALRQMLRANPNVDLISFFILRTQDDISLVPNDEMSLIPFPTRELFEEQLPSFDVIVLQDFEYAPYGIGDYLENIRSYVQGGGGLAMLGGATSFSSGGYAGTPVAEALPVELYPIGGDTALDTSRFAPQLTTAGLQHPVTALRYAPADNAAAWKSLPQLEGVNLIARAKAGATVLATHPRLRTADGAPMPVITAGDYGTGRSLAVTTDTLWRWGFVAAQRPGDDGRQYTKFWENAIRWLIQDPDLRNLHVDTDAVEYLPSTPVRVTTRLLGRDYQPVAGGKITLVVKSGADPGKATEVARVELTTSDDGTSSHELPGMPAGVYRVEGSADVDGKQQTASDIFLVREGGSELDRPTGDADSLALLSASTGGTALGAIDHLPAGLDFDPPRVVRVDRRTDVELWSRPGLLLLAVFLLGLEWLLRQRSGYL